jgi:HK97 gp10 family phage protein
MELTVNVQGLQGLEDALAQAGPKIARRALRAGLKASSDVILAATLPHVPILKVGTPQREPGELRDAMVAKIKLSATEEAGYAVIGPEYKKADGAQSPGVYGLMVELGSVHGRAQPYMRPGWEESKNAALDTFASKMREGVDSLK